MITTDRRVKRTEKLLMDALIRLSLERGYDTLTIKDITDQADVAYSTFFRHYPDKPALLAAMVGETVTTLRNLIRQLPEDTPEEEGRVLFQHINEHEALYRAILSSRDSKDVMQPVLEEIQQDLITHYQAYGPAAIPLDVAANHVVTAIIALVNWWLKHGKPYSIEQMGTIYSELIIKATVRSAFGVDKSSGEDF